MPSQFKRSQDCEPVRQPHAAASRASHTALADADNHQLLVALGLAEEGDAAVEKPAASAMDDEGGAIGAFYPPQHAERGPQVGGSGGGVFEDLQARVRAATAALQAGPAQLDAAVQHEVKQLLHEQQHQIELLQRGQSSLKGSMANLRRASKEQETRNRGLQQLEQQYRAALRDMEAKLERAIQHVQHLQRAGRERQQQQQQQQQAAALQPDTTPLATTAEDMQAALVKKELFEALQQLQQTEEQLQAQQPPQPEEHRAASYAKQALGLNSTSHAELCHLKHQLSAADAAQHKHKQRCAELQQQLAQSQAAHAAASAENAELLDRLAAASAAADARLAGSSQEAQQLRQQLEEASTRHSSLEDRLAGLQAQLFAAVQARADAQMQHDSAVADRVQMQAKLRRAQAELDAAKQQQGASAAQCEQWQAERQSLQQQAQAAAKQAEAAGAKCSAADDEMQRLHWQLNALHTEHQKAQRAAAAEAVELRRAAEQAAAQLVAVQAGVDARVQQVQAEAAAEVEQYRVRWRQEFDKRRSLHNQVIELKGNIRVLVRIRPLIEKEHSASSGSSGGATADAAVRAVDEETVALQCTAAGQTREFVCDRAFGPADGQLQVYHEVSAVVVSILDGFNACILAYGQTGSGKTFTMDGPADDPGINTRALAELFQQAGERASEVSYSLSASVLELYNERVIDLLAGSKDTSDKLDIKEGPGGLFIPNLRVEAVHSPSDVAAAMQKGRQHRSTFGTEMNQHSSRSHAVLTVYVTAKQLATGATWSSKLHLVDLAGSERVSRSGAEGERLKEAAAINKSLSALGDVVSALQQRLPHVPYRNSKLTRLLEDSLGGSSKCLLVVNCSPAAENVAETKCSLEFGARARKVELGAAVRASVDPACSSPVGPVSGRDSPALASPVKAAGTAGGCSSPRSVGRASAAAANGSELRQAFTRRAAATMPPAVT